MPYGFFQVLDPARPRPSVPEQGPVHFLRRIPAGAADDDPAAFLVPFENRPRTDAELPPYLGWNRDLTLCGDSGMSNGHANYITTVM